MQQRWWLPNDVIRNDSFNGLPPFAIAYYEIGRWYFEGWSARVLDPRTGKRVLLSKVHGPEYMSGSLHWQHIKDRKSYVHAERMWVGNKIVESVRAFADVVFPSIESGNTKVPWFQAYLKRYSLPAHSRASGVSMSTCEGYFEQLQKDKVTVTYLGSNVTNVCFVSGLRCLSLIHI